MKDVPFSGVILDEASLGPNLNLAAFNELPINWLRYPSTDVSQLIKRCQNCHVIVVNKVPLSSEVLNQLPELKLICVAATGTNNVDLITAQKRNIKVMNVTDYAGVSIAQQVFSYLLHFYNQTPLYHQKVVSGQWSKSSHFSMFDYPMEELAGKTIGLIGYGRLAKSVEKIATAFEMKVIIAEHKNATDVRTGRTDFQTVLQQADVISIHCPLTDETDGLIGEAEFELMKSSAIVINTARGGIIDEGALITALKSGQIAAAATDVVTVEPPDQSHPMVTANLNNLIITPHVAWSSIQARQRLLDKVVDNIKLGLLPH